ncbi:uncharacterized protein BDR25DRAFT_392541 [Lindgomyces ingoldianus]|uniref:Uncharacterized protein n=1 Tax=Lindgomyces ingoldianus TaxID=673940 RepID=A0ACB6R220_9PLEO|nr:uncharacterized protein BDR25DRAFT_392541 [Lindgomyces ingoldianus]KAF2473374.1 hypothetical protein BDR25DRAFT_392541 [Lindgomyces ingoldianus]
MGITGLTRIYPRKFAPAFWNRRLYFHTRQLTDRTARPNFLLPLRYCEEISRQPRPCRVEGSIFKFDSRLTDPTPSYRRRAPSPPSERHPVPPKPENPQELDVLLSSPVNTMIRRTSSSKDDLLFSASCSREWVCLLDTEKKLSWYWISGCFIWHIYACGGEQFLNALPRNAEPNPDGSKNGTCLKAPQANSHHLGVFLSSHIATPSPRYSFSTSSHSHHVLEVRPYDYAFNALISSHDGLTIKTPSPLALIMPMTPSLKHAGGSPDRFTNTILEKEGSILLTISMTHDFARTRYDSLHFTSIWIILKDFQDGADENVSSYQWAAYDRATSLIFPPLWKKADLDGRARQRGGGSIIAPQDTTRQQHTTEKPNVEADNQPRYSTIYGSRKWQSASPQNAFSGTTFKLIGLLSFQHQQSAVQSHPARENKAQKYSSSAAEPHARYHRVYQQSEGEDFGSLSELISKSKFVHRHETSWRKQELKASHRHFRYHFNDYGFVERLSCPKGRCFPYRLRPQINFLIQQTLQQIPYLYNSLQDTPFVVDVLPWRMAWRLGCIPSYWRVRYFVQDVYEFKENSNKSKLLSFTLGILRDYVSQNLPASPFIIEGASDLSSGKEENRNAYTVMLKVIFNVNSEYVEPLRSSARNWAELDVSSEDNLEQNSDRFSLQQRPPPSFEPTWSDSSLGVLGLERRYMRFINRSKERAVPLSHKCHVKTILLLDSRNLVITQLNMSICYRFQSGGTAEILDDEELCKLRPMVGNGRDNVRLLFGDSFESRFSVVRLGFDISLDGRICLVCTTEQMSIGEADKTAFYPLLIMPNAS